MFLNSTFFRYSARSPHRATKPSRGWLGVGGRKPRVVLSNADPTRNKVTAKERTDVLGCVERQTAIIQKSFSLNPKHQKPKLLWIAFWRPTHLSQHFIWLAFSVEDFIAPLRDRTLARTFVNITTFVFRGLFIDMWHVTCGRWPVVGWRYNCRRPKLPKIETPRSLGGRIIFEYLRL